MFVRFECECGVCAEYKPGEVRAGGRGGAAGRRGAHDHLAHRHHHRDHGTDLQRAPHHCHPRRRQVDRGLLQRGILITVVC